MIHLFSWEKPRRLLARMSNAKPKRFTRCVSAEKVRERGRMEYAIRHPLGGEKRRPYPYESKWHPDATRANRSPGRISDNSLPLDTPLLLPLPRCQASRHEVQPDSSTAKDWVRKPGGAIRRKDRMGIFPVSSLRLVGLSGSVAVPSPNSARASGLESQLPGSAGRLSRPATVKLL